MPLSPSVYDVCDIRLLQNAGFAYQRPAGASQDVTAIIFHTNIFSGIHDRPHGAINSSRAILPAIRGQRSNPDARDPIAWKMPQVRQRASRIGSQKAVGQYDNRGCRARHENGPDRVAAKTRSTRLLPTKLVKVRSTAADGFIDPGNLQRRWAPYVRTHGSGQGQLPLDQLRPQGLRILSRGADRTTHIGHYLDSSNRQIIRKHFHPIR